MAGSVRGFLGGIGGLLDLIDGYGEALEHDLVVAGWTLDDVPGRLNWRAVRAFVAGQAAKDGTALHRATAGDQAGWGLTQHLLAGLYDQLAVANWQRAASGAKRAPKKPSPLPRPGIDDGQRSEKSTAIPLSEFQRISEARNPQSVVNGDRQQ